MRCKHIEAKPPIYEFGSLKVDQGPTVGFREYFKGVKYVGCDMRPGTGVDCVLDLHSIDMPDGSVPTILCMDTLEHVEFPRLAVKEMGRILRPDGLLVISSVMNFPIHEYPDDYWRFTPAGFQSLLRDFPTVHIGYQGRREFPNAVFGIGWKKKTSIPENFLNGYRNWKNRMEKIREKMEAMPEEQITRIMGGVVDG